MTMRESAVDVIIPTFNRAYCLAATIDSVLAQTHERCRALVIDDGSTDTTCSLVETRYGGNEKVVYVRRDNGGVASARNAGLALATADHVALLDSDDVWKPWKVRLQLDCLAALPPDVGMIWTDMSAVDSAGTIVAERYLRRMYSAYQRRSTPQLFAHAAKLTDLQGPDRRSAGHFDRADGVDAAAMLYWGDIFAQMIHGNLVHTSTVLLTRERAANVGGFNEALRHSGEDYDFHLRTCRAGPVAFVDVASILYRVGNEDQLTRPEYRIHMARNFLATIEPVIRSDRARIDADDAELRALLARAHAWIANEMFESADYRGARRHSIASLRRGPLQKRMWLLAALATLPAGARERLLRAYRGRKAPRS